MRSSLIRVGSELRKTQRLFAMQRMAYNTSEDKALTAQEKTIIHKLDMDSLPVPSGDWATEYGKAQLKFNIHLVLSAVLFFGCLYRFMSKGYVIRPDKDATKRPINLEEIYQSAMAARREEEGS